MRLLLFVVANDESGSTGFDKQSLYDLLGQQVAKWWLPDDIITVAELPRTATGKLEKNVLREQYQSYLSES